MAQLVCRNLSVGYDGKAIISGLGFTVESGSYLCVFGDNGAGKSTLLKTVLNLQKPLSGQIEFHDIDRRELGYLPQQTDIQRDFPASVYEIVLSGCLPKCGLRPFYSKAEKGKAFGILGRLGIEHLQKRCYRELSGGQQQRVLLARALCAADKMIFLDEPVSGLDPQAAESLYGILYRLNRDDGITVVMVSHDPAAALKYASHILHIQKNGYYYGAKEDYLSARSAALIDGTSDSGDKTNGNI